MTLFSEKVLISNRCISGLMSNLIKKSWTDSTVPPGPAVPLALLLARFLEPVTYGWQENLLTTHLRTFVLLEKLNQIFKLQKVLTMENVIRIVLLLLLFTTNSYASLISPNDTGMYILCSIY